MHCPIRGDQQQRILVLRQRSLAELESVAAAPEAQADELADLLFSLLGHRGIEGDARERLGNAVAAHPKLSPLTWSHALEQGYVHGVAANPSLPLYLLAVGAWPERLDEAAYAALCRYDLGDAVGRDRSRRLARAMADWAAPLAVLSRSVCGSKPLSKFLRTLTSRTVPKHVSYRQMVQEREFYGWIIVQLCAVRAADSDPKKAVPPRVRFGRAKALASALAAEGHALNSLWPLLPG